MINIPTLRPTAIKQSISPNTLLLFNFLNGYYQDESNYHNPTIISVSNTEIGTGPNGENCYVHGSTGYVQTVASGSLFITGDFTQEMFIKMANVVGYQRPFGGGWSANYYLASVFDLGAPGVAVGQYGSSWLASPIAWSSGSRYHVAAVRKNGSINYYVNGIAISPTASYSGSIGITNYNWYIGKDGDYISAGQNCTPGMRIASVRISNIALYSGSFSIPTGSLK